MGPGPHRAPTFEANKVPDTNAKLRHVLRGGFRSARGRGQNLAEDGLPTSRIEWTAGVEGLAGSGGCRLARDGLSRVS